MGTYYPLPFFAASDVLPAPLPTPEAITASQDVLQDYSGRHIVRIGAHFVAKYGVAVNLTEGENMLYVKQFSTTPVPAVYAIYSRQTEGDKYPTNYIVMENIAGRTLKSCWSSLDTTTKAEIASQLRNHISRLRQIPSPGYFGVLGKRPFEDSVFWTEHDESRQVISGPFDSERQMIAAMIEKYVLQNPGYWKSEYYSRILPMVLRSPASVFTHGDFQRKNIVLTEDGQAVVIDWEAAGWYPSFWEYSTAMFSCRWDDDWHSWISQILDEYPNEYAWMNMIFRELWS